MTELTRAGRGTLKLEKSFTETDRSQQTFDHPFHLLVPRIRRAVYPPFFPGKKLDELDLHETVISHSRSWIVPNGTQKEVRYLPLR